jgi:hypothetical protein
MPSWQELRGFAKLTARPRCRYKASTQEVKKTASTICGGCDTLFWPCVFDALWRIGIDVFSMKTMAGYSSVTMSEK